MQWPRHEPSRDRVLSSDSCSGRLPWALCSRTIMVLHCGRGGACTVVELECVMPRRCVFDYGTPCCCTGRPATRHKRLACNVNTQVQTSTLLSAVSTQMQETRTESTDVGASASGPAIGVTASASATMASASSSGVVTFHSSAGRSESESEDWCVCLVETMHDDLPKPFVVGDVLI